MKKMKKEKRTKKLIKSKASKTPIHTKHYQDPFADREAEKYSNPIPSRECLLAFLSERGRPATYPEIQKELSLFSEDESEALRRRLIAMVRDGQLLKNRKGAYGPLEDMELIAGRVIGHKEGFGFVAPELGGDDLFLTPRQMRAVFHGDKVLVRVSNVDTRGRREAMIVEVLEQNTKQLVGRYHSDGHSAYIEPSNPRVNQPIMISPDSKLSAEDGQMVLVAVSTYPSQKSRPWGEIIEVLGDHMAPGMEINVAIYNHNLPTIWPSMVEEESERFPARVDERAYDGRVDLRQLPFVTIDGEDAKDFDDAVYCVAQPKGGWLLYVAIADVSHYVTPTTALDKEAFVRGNSVYFPGRVIPMLPEALSNNLCSLKPEVDRLVLTCEMSIHPSGRITRYKFYEAVIHSHARLTYRSVHEAMEKKDNKARTRLKASLGPLTDLYELHGVLHGTRAARGAIDFNLPETKIVFGKNRKIDKIVPYERFLSHRVIEECMLSANICAAKFLEKKKMPALYRVHEGPKERKLDDLRQFLREMGLKMPANKRPVPSDYANILNAIGDRPDAHMIQTVLLRSMSQAIYSPENKGHFGLAYEAYTHFTSPIRRYPDLLVHRAIKEVLANKEPPADLNMLSQAGEHCSMTERRADEATREVTDWLKCEYMLDKVGESFDGIISGVTSFGVFVELKNIYVEGLVHISTLPSDYYRFDAVKHVLRGERGGREFRLGEPIRITVARVTVDEREIDFVVEEEPKAQKKRTSEKKQKRKRKKQ